MKYRAEIDGLRALAVVPVILFHAGFELFSGGFVGVDVFFVISGYLITTILIEDIENQRFSLVNFYERRARRILPALFFVMLLCIPFALMIFDPLQFREFSQSIFATTIFMSNFFFFLKTNYFGLSAEEKPLLHTWSLAVEEQYYVLFPIFLILAWRFGKNRVFWMIVGMAVISLMASEWGWRKHPAANFYLAPTRAWELFAGSIAAFIVQRNGVQKSNFLALFGLAAIIFSIFGYDESTPFPSVYALVPVLGVLLLILYADKQTLAARLLSTKAFVGIGLISFSAYLWHQPLLVFARMSANGELRSAQLLSILFIIFLMSIVTWKYIEKPFRDKTIVSRLAVIKLSTLSFLALSMFGLSIHSMSYRDIGAFQLKEGMMYEMDFEVLKEESIEFTKSFSYEDFSAFNSSKIRLLILGDSIADDFTAAIRISEELEQVLEVRYLNYDDLCFDPQYSSNECITWRDNLLMQQSLFEQADVIAVVVGLHPQTNIRSFAMNFNHVKDKTILIGSAHFNDPFSIFDTQIDKQGLSIILGKNKHTYTVDSSVRAEKLLFDYEYNFFSLYDLICADELVCEATDEKGNLLIFDTAHRTRAGIEFLSHKIEEHYETIFHRDKTVSR